MSFNKEWKKEMREVLVCAKGDFICDNCKKTIDITNQDGTYYHVASGHYEWVNDSCDSVESQDACCDDCLRELVNEWLDKWRGFNTAYIEINRETFSHARTQRGDGYE